MIDKIRRKLNGDIHLKDLVKGSAITFVLKMGGMALSYILIFLISKQLGAEGVGFFQVMLQILTVLGMVLGLGMNISVLRYVGQFNNEKDRPKMHDLYRYFVSVVGPLAILVGVVIYFASDYFAIWLGKDLEYALGLKLIAFVMPFFTINQISVEFIRGLKQLQISELIRSVLRPLIMILGISLFFWNQLSKTDVIYLLIVGLIINSIVSRWAIWNALKKVPKTSLMFQRKEFMKTSFPMLATNVSSVIILSLPIFFLDIFTNQKITGVYTVFYKLSIVISLILVVVNTITAPIYSNLYWEGKYHDLKKVLKQSVRITSSISFFVLIFLLIFLDSIVNLIGEQYNQYKYLFYILGFGQFISSLSGPSGMLLNMTGNQKYLRNLNLFLLFISTLLYYPLSKYFGVIGVSILFSITLILQNLVGVYFVYKKLKLIAIFH